MFGIGDTFRSNHLLTQGSYRHRFSTCLQCTTGKTQRVSTVNEDLPGTIVPEQAPTIVIPGKRMLSSYPNTLTRSRSSALCAKISY